MRFWRLDSYDGVPNEEAPHVGAIICTRKRGNPGSWASGSVGTHFNSATNEWVSARWVECEDPRQVSS